MPVIPQRIGNRPRFIYNQVDAYLNNPKITNEDYFQRRT